MANMKSVSTAETDRRRRWQPVTAEAEPTTGALRRMCASGSVKRRQSGALPVSSGRSTSAQSLPIICRLRGNAVGS